MHTMVCLLHLTTLPTSYNGTKGIWASKETPKVMHCPLCPDEACISQQTMSVWPPWHGINTSLCLWFRFPYVSSSHGLPDTNINHLENHKGVCCHVCTKQC